ncbi:hypothetical protein NEOLEDRAFT_1245152 [Neolentinus lepideus HHB14362 ss-1]|uniref:Uncharacterized protein n=1 Tax=Neolentinus lepideus HHB14362 ss-1 TaxID=1314782 RepID=A0A165P6W5_9AGAM|nr:hypothetical protein NEOLEDRAFT_1245152 [Neolentinus lepideus HHB14362 ss-1]
MESSHHSLSGGSDFSGTNLATSFPTSDELALLEASFPSEAVNTDLARLDESLFSRHRNFELGNDSTPEHSHGQSMGPMGRIDPSGNTSDHSNFIQRKWISSNQGTNSHYSPRPVGRPRASTSYGQMTFSPGDVRDSGSRDVRDSGSQGNTHQRLAYVGSLDESTLLEYCPAYRQLHQKYLEAKQDLGQAKQDLGKMAQDLAVAKGQSDALQSALSTVAAARPAQQTLAGERGFERGLESLNLPIQASPSWRTKVDFSEAALRRMFWTVESWNDPSNRPNEKQAPAGPRGKLRQSQGINVAMRFVTNEAGDIIDGHRSARIREHATSFFHALLQVGKAPLSWGKCKCLATKLAFYNYMKHTFPELVFCDDNWKLDLIAQDVYHGFSARHVKPQLLPMNLDVSQLETIEDKDGELIADLGAAATPSTTSQLGSPVEKRKAPVQAPVELARAPKKKKLSLKNALSGLVPSTSGVVAQSSTATLTPALPLPTSSDAGTATGSTLTVPTNFATSDGNPHAGETSIGHIGANPDTDATNAAVSDKTDSVDTAPGPGTSVDEESVDRADITPLANMENVVTGGAQMDTTATNGAALASTSNGVDSDATASRASKSKKYMSIPETIKSSRQLFAKEYLAANPETTQWQFGRLWTNKSAAEKEEYEQRFKAMGPAPKSRRGKRADKENK